MPEFTIYTEFDRPGFAEVPPYIVGDPTSWAISFERADGTVYMPTGVQIRVGHVNGLADGSYPSAFKWHDRCGNEHIASVTVTTGVPALSWSASPAGGFVGSDGVYILRGQIPDGRVIDFASTAKLLTLQTNETLSTTSTVSFRVDGRDVATGRVEWGIASYDIKLVVTASGSGYTTIPTVVFSGGDGTGMAAVAILDELGGVISVRLTNLGSGYTSAPTVAFTGGGGIGATVAAEYINTASGQIKMALISNRGSGYTSAPTVTLGDQNTGTGGEITALGWDTVSGLSLVTAGSGYVSPLTVSFSGGGGSGAAATALTGPVRRVSWSKGPGYVFWTAPTDTFTETFPFPAPSGPGETAFIAVTFTRQNTGFNINTENEYNVASISVTKPGAGYTTAPTVTRYGHTFTGVVNEPILIITNPGSGYTSAPTVAVTGSGGTGSGMAVDASVGRITGLAVVSRGSGYTATPTITISGGGGTGATGRVVIDSAAAFYRVLSTEVVSSTGDAKSTPTVVGSAFIKNTITNAERTEDIRPFIGTISAGVEIADLPYKRAESSTAVVGAVRLTAYSDGRYDNAGNLQYDHSALVILPRTIGNSSLASGANSSGTLAAVGILNPVNAHVTSRLALRRTAVLDIQVFGDGRMLFQGTLPILAKIA